MRPGSKRTNRVGVVALTAVMLTLLTGVAPSWADTGYIVNTSSDENDGSCTDGDCSLHDAINLANSDGVGSTITFSVSTINQLDAFSDVSAPVVIDGTTAPGGRVTINPGNLTVAVFVVASSNVTIKGFQIANDGLEGVAGIRLQSGTGHTISNNLIYDWPDGNISFNAGQDTQPAPTITGTPTISQVAYSVPTEVGTSYRVELFSCQGDFEGRTFEGAQDIPAAEGESFAGTFAVNVPVGTRFSATATNLTSGDTSNYSGCSTGAENPNLETVTCPDNGTCQTSPPPGTDTQFTVEAGSGNGEATLEAELNGGLAPDCAKYGERSADWVRFGFTTAVGADRTKVVTLRRIQLTSKKQATRELAKRQVCFAAPYSFATRKGFPRTVVAGDFTGVLPECPRTDGNPCVSARRLVQVGSQWTFEIEFTVPPNAQDPRGRS